MSPLKREHQRRCSTTFLLLLALAAVTMFLKCDSLSTINAELKQKVGEIRNMIKLEAEDKKQAWLVSEIDHNSDRKLAILEPF